MRSVYVAEKECRKCHTVKPAAAFSVEKRNRDGISAWCKRCHTVRARESYLLKYVPPPPRHKMSLEERRRRAREHANKPAAVARRKAAREEKRQIDPNFLARENAQRRLRTREKARKTRIGSIRMYLTMDEVELIRACRVADAYRGIEGGL